MRLQTDNSGFQGNAGYRKGVEMGPRKVKRVCMKNVILYFVYGPNMKPIRMLDVCR